MMSIQQLTTLDIQSYIQFTNDTVYWQANSFKFGFQNVTTFFKLGGNDVNIYGGGTIDGNGQVWYDLYAANIYTLRPVLIGIDGLHNSILSNLVLRYSPEYYHFVANSTNVIFDNINIAGHSTSINVAKNTDGWDTYRSSDIVIQNSVVNNGDGKHSKTWPSASTNTFPKIACLSSPTAPTSWCRTCGVTAPTASRLALSASTRGSSISLRTSTFSMRQCTTQL
jgi:Glycosyl hydrolases family 28